MTHIIPSFLIEDEVQIVLAGCGGNGSQMLTGLARLDHALRGLGHKGLRVDVYDPDTVSEANMGRQLFGAFDIGQSKAHVLTHRINGFFGLDWTAHFARYEPDGWIESDIVICCVDSARARAQIYRKLKGYDLYLLDLGNRASDGQVVLGQMSSEKAKPQVPGSTRLPCPYDLLPELIDTSKPEDDTPSCGLAEALERQELFVNQSVVTPALQLLWQMFRYGRLEWHGAYVNLKNGTMVPIPVSAANPQQEAA